MADGWKAVPVSEVRVGDVVRTQSGEEVVVSRIEEAFFGMPDDARVHPGHPRTLVQVPAAGGRADRGRSQWLDRLGSPNP